MKKLLLFLIILNFSCSTKTKESIDEFDLTNSHKLEFLNKNIYLPKNYEATTIEDFINAHIVDGKIDSFQKNQQANLYKQKRNGVKFEIFCEKSNLKNSIIIQLGEYTPLDKRRVNPYVNNLEKTVLSEWSKYYIYYERLEAKFITSKNTKSIKIKYRIIIDGKNTFMTQYIVTSKSNTFSIVVTNEKNIDYQFVLKNFSNY